MNESTEFVAGDKFDLIVYLGQDWRNYHRKQMLIALADEMENIGNILCIERPVCPITTAIFRPWKFWEWLMGKRGIKQERSNLFIYTPFVLIHDQIASCFCGVTKINRAILSVFLEKVIRKINLKNKRRLSWLYNPFQIDYIGLVGEDGFIYECLDDYNELCKSPIISKEKIKIRDRELVKRAKIVFTTAQFLYERNKKYNNNTFYIPNGVDLKSFQPLCGKESSVPKDLKNIPEPRFGFVGNLNDAYVDCSMLIETAKANYNWSFVFIGPVTRSRRTKKLRRLSNVYFLGFKQYDELPKYLRAFNAGMIPFRINKITLCLNPLKLYEYMAAGCPIVSTNIPEVRKYTPFVKIGVNKVEFAAALNSNINSGQFKMRKALQDEARSHSWDRRVDQVIKFIQKYAT